MNWERIEGNWDQLVGSVREQWGRLTDSEVQQVKGKRDKLAGKLMERYGSAKEEAERQVDDWASRH